MTSLQKRYEQQVLEDVIKDQIHAWRLWAEDMASWAAESAEVKYVDELRDDWAELEELRLVGARLMGSIEATLAEAQSLKRVPR
jgi:hypothetical protein